MPTSAVLLATSAAPMESRPLFHKIKRNELQPGDHIYSRRARGLVFYTHHGIFVGDGEVIDFDGPIKKPAGKTSSVKSLASRCDKCGHGEGVSGVKSTCLDCFLRGGKLYRYQYGVSSFEFGIKIRGTCTTAVSDPAPDVIHRAKVLLQNNDFGEYNLKKRNCEDFARYCKTGKGVGGSSQIKHKFKNDDDDEESEPLYSNKIKSDELKPGDNMEESKALRSHKISRNQLKPGDHIYSWRAAGLFLYSHHGIYVGDGDPEVIDFSSVSNSTFGIGSSSRSMESLASHCDKCGDKEMVDGVRSICLDCFLHGGKLYRYQYGVSFTDFRTKIRGMCTTADSDPASDVIHRAKRLLETNGFGEYDLKRRNCENFACYCKTGLEGGKSSQIALFSALKRSYLALSKTRFFKHRFENDIGQRKDILKVSVEELIRKVAKKVCGICCGMEHPDKDVYV